MLEKIILSRIIFEKLIMHLVQIEDEKLNLLEEYFPQPSKDRKDISVLLDNYTAKIDDLIKNNITVIQKAGNTGNNFPFVIIYSEVEIKDLKTGQVNKIRIVPPFKNKESNDVSYLSPIGRSLLLKNIGDKTVVKAPGGEFCYQINSIKLSYF